MPSPFSNSGFSDLILRKGTTSQVPLAILGGVTGSSFGKYERLDELPVVVFDFETTGLDTKTCRIIEIGAIKYINRREVERFSMLIDPGLTIDAEITSVTGITPEMLVGAPKIESVLPQFHDFVRGCVGIAHNAEFDCGVLVSESARLGISCDYTVICSLKLARAFVNSERKNLDALAAHYGLEFESRHRSIGDILVTAEVLWRILDANPHCATLKDFESYMQLMDAF